MVVLKEKACKSGRIVAGENGHFTFRIETIPTVEG